MDWPTNEKTWENLMPIIDTVEEIYLTGGEPTLALEQYKLFDHCIKLDKAKDIIQKIKITTYLLYIIKTITTLPFH